MVSGQIPAAAGAFSGTIKMFDIQKGWGHIDCEQTKTLYGKDMFLLRSQLNGVVPVKGDAVWFDVVDGQKGPEAANVSIESQAAGEGSFNGVIKSWNAEKGWGHIQCDQTYYLYEKDIFVMRSALPGGLCLQGDQVSFTIKDGEKGPEAAAVCVTTSAAMPLPANISPNMQHKNFVGVVKEFNPTRGFGFIVCDATRELYGKDIIVLRSVLQGATLSGGEQVQFAVGMGAKGPEAHSIVLLGHGQMSGQPFVGQVARNMAVQGMPQQVMHMPQHQQHQQHQQMPQHQQMMPGQHKGGKGASPQMIQANANALMKRFSGTVKNWNEEKGWGFVTCQDTMNIYGKDIFLHRVDSGVSDQTIIAGAPVKFSVSTGGDGRPVASAVKVTGGRQGVQNGVQLAGKGARVSPY